ncbi:MAG: mechanosensitive ion channel domain-containing protein [Elusimicrobiota bacterium]
MHKALPLIIVLLVPTAFAAVATSHAAVSVPTTEAASTPVTGQQKLGEVRRGASRLSLKILIAALLFALAWLAILTSTYLLDLIGERSARYRFLKKGIPIIRVLVWAGTAYIIVRWVFSPTRDAFFAVLTASGVAIGFASQDILKNIFGGLVIILDRPFQVGDKIRIGEHYGEVVGIGLRTVRLVTSDDNLVTVPNAEIVNRIIANANSGALTCQVVTEITLPPETDLLAAKRTAWEAAVTSRYINLAKPIVVLFQDAPSEKQLRTTLKIKAYVLDPRFEFAFSSDVTEIFKLAMTAKTP